MFSIQKTLVIYRDVWFHLKGISLCFILFIASLFFTCENSTDQRIKKKVIIFFLSHLLLLPLFCHLELDTVSPLYKLLITDVMKYSSSGFTQINS